MKYYLLILLLFCQICAADCQQEFDRCVQVDHWNFSVSVGAGVVTNPLQGGDNIPLIIIPSISYYGENLFFENNTLGYSFFDNDHFIVSAISQVNHEKSYFSRWHPENVFLESSSSNTAATVPDIDTGEQTDNGLTEVIPEPVVNINDISSRDWAIDAGIQLNWFINQSTDMQFKILHDVNNIYNGFNGQLEFTRMLNFDALPNTMLSFSLGVNWNSNALVDYYYGISKERDPDIKTKYEGEQSINPYFRIVMKHQLSENWQIKLHLKRVFLADGTKNSPLVKEDHITTVFAGVIYDF